MSGGHLCEAEAPTEAAVEKWLAEGKSEGEKNELQSFVFSLTIPQSAYGLTAADGGRPLCRFATKILMYPP